MLVVKEEEVLEVELGTTGVDDQEGRMVEEEELVQVDEVEVDEINIEVVLDHVDELEEELDHVDELVEEDVIGSPVDPQDHPGYVDQVADVERSGA